MAPSKEDFQKALQTEEPFVLAKMFKLPSIARQKRGNEPSTSSSIRMEVNDLDWSPVMNHWFNAYKAAEAVSGWLLKRYMLVYVLLAKLTFFNHLRDMLSNVTKAKRPYIRVSIKSSLHQPVIGLFRRYIRYAEILIELPLGLTRNRTDRIILNWKMRHLCCKKVLAARSMIGKNLNLMRHLIAKGPKRLECWRLSMNFLQFILGWIHCGCAKILSSQ